MDHNIDTALYDAGLYASQRATELTADLAARVQEQVAEVVHEAKQQRAAVNAAVILLGQWPVSRAQAEAEVGGFIREAERQGCDAPAVVSRLSGCRAEPRPC